MIHTLNMQEVISKELLEANPAILRDKAKDMVALDSDVSMLVVAHSAGPSFIPSITKALLEIKKADEYVVYVTCSCWWGDKVKKVVELKDEVHFINPYESREERSDWKLYPYKEDGLALDKVNFIMSGSCCAYDEAVKALEEIYLDVHLKFKNK